ncbi:MAG: hypothetical protein CMG78_12105 [Marinobacter sp.]|nr:hypothetical protein [Marinobacter sp.]|tara:strand:+ start:1665 stop:1844 length:180 start_codon:yes stop_codon:yes gene_type:complete
MDEQERRSVAEYIADKFAHGMDDVEVAEVLDSWEFQDNFGRPISHADLISIIRDLMMDS